MQLDVNSERSTESLREEEADTGWKQMNAPVILKSQLQITGMTITVCYSVEKYLCMNSMEKKKDL
jgi:hypothetical protein